MRNRTEETIVKKSNTLIFGKLALSLNEIKLLNLAISQVRDSDFGFKYTIDIGQLNKNFEQKPKRLKEIAKNIMGKIIELPPSEENPNGWRSIVLVSYAEYFPETRTINIRFDSELIPFLIEIKKNYTSYQIENILKLQSSYAIRFYEIFRKEFNTQKQYLKATKTYKLSYLYELFEIPISLRKPSKFRKNIISKIEQINIKTDLHIEYEELKTGKKITDIKFIIREKVNLNKDKNSSLYYVKKINEFREYTESEKSEHSKYIEDTYENCLTNTFIDKVFLIENDVYKLKNILFVESEKEEGPDIFKLTFANGYRNFNYEKKYKYGATYEKLYEFLNPLVV